MIGATFHVDVLDIGIYRVNFEKPSGKITENWILFFVRKKGLTMSAAINFSGLLIWKRLTWG